ncbi:MAG: DUF262 domain-containing protein [Methylococcales symbiont of Hymedesmia sp. n. MRB-2018]|nr:MAG: DUF262 domain-containing protein [Methylococcales symbiont of Hymedesmia sp. n. MRB-2018]
MEIKLKEITVADLVKDYADDTASGQVVGYGGKLDIRPKYQREFIYKDEQRSAVIDTLTKDFPLNVMYWAVRDDGGFEVIDGQQRTISVCQYVNGDFSYKELYFNNLQDDKQAQILNYKLSIYQCSGSDSEKLEWFKTINIAGEKLTNQELRNAVYSGAWVSDAKRYFSRNGCAAHNIANKYLTGSSIRQDYLETAIKWISDNKIEDYMATNQHKPKADELWLYFQNVINWVEIVFAKYRKEMKGVDFGFLYNQFKDDKFDSDKLEAEIAKLMQDDDVTKKSGIYPFALTGKEKYLNIRAFTDNQKRETYEKQKGICKKCKKEFTLVEMEADHIKPWHEGGKTITKNCQMLCKDDNRRKSGK